MTTASDNRTHPFEKLTPDFIMDAVESCGFRCDCRVLTLNSYENRVYQVGVEEQPPLIVKFYRPGRWNRRQILEEHRFLAELAEHELPVIPPLADPRGRTLQHFADLDFSLSPRQGGQAPELDNLDHLESIGRALGRIHAIGAIRPFTWRPRLDSDSYGHQSVSFISDSFIPPEYRESYCSLTRDLLLLVDQHFARIPDIRRIRTHSDCHSGNILWRDQVPYFVDFDDARMAPAVQDLWMLLSGPVAQQRLQLERIMSGYEEFFDFDRRELQWIEALRTLRMLNFSAWLARRWGDPAFVRAFPWFNSIRYWGEHILELREQMAALQEPCLL
jgi:Ser/Thr protein kinase RdoA (MazF antagonist)